MLYGISRIVGLNIDTSIAANLHKIWLETDVSAFQL